MLWLYYAADIIKIIVLNSEEMLRGQFIAIMLGKDGSLEKRLPENTEIAQPSFEREQFHV